ncbi:MAG: hypothetical protein IJM90_06700, partial [Firmicutes bacterium]|nr:hypothetical protein [Bacillota bacterium]
MKTKHHLRSFLAILLVCSLFAQILPTPVHAAEPELSPMDAPETPGEVDEIPDTDALEEEPGLRSANSKTFLMEDGSHTVATYGITV